MIQNHLRRHVCEYCPQVVLIASSEFDEAYGKNLIPLRICHECYDNNKHEDKNQKEFVMVGVNIKDSPEDILPF